MIEDEVEVKSECIEVVGFINIGFLPKWVQFWIIQIWWLITSPHHYIYSEIERAKGRKILIFASEECGQLIEKYLIFRGRRV